jgi:hypothetical protein
VLACWGGAQSFCGKKKISKEKMVWAGVSLLGRRSKLLRKKENKQRKNGLGLI